MMKVALALLACATVVVPAALADSYVALVALLFGGVIVAALSLERPRTYRCAFWVLFYLALSVGVRAVVLAQDSERRAPVLAVYRPGLGLEERLGQALRQSLVALVCFVLAYSLTMAVRRRDERHETDFRIRTAAATGWMLVSIATIPVQLGLLSAAGGEVTAGGDFAVALPGYLAVGVSALVVFAWTSGRTAFPPLLISLAVVNAAIRAVYLHSKITALAMLLAALIGYVVRPHERTARSRVSTAGVGALIALIALIVFARSAGSPEDSVAQQIESGAGYLASRSYGVDSLIVINKAYDEGKQPQLGGTVSDLPVSWIPRRIWPEKPRTFSERFGAEYFSFSPLAGRGFYAPSYTGEWLLNFGRIGIVVGWLLLGWICARLDTMRSVAWHLLALIAITHVVEGSLVAQAWLAAPMLLAIPLVTAPHVRE